MRIERFILSLAAVLAILGSSQVEAVAEPLEFTFEHYSSDDGLPHNSICDIHQDRRGYLWLCTWYGLSRYDGNEFVNYTMLPGDYSTLSHNRILSIDEDASGYLWVLTYDYHLYRFDVDEESFTAVPDELDGFLGTSAKVDRIFCDSNADVWVSVAGTGLLKVAPDLSYRQYFNVSAHNVGKEIAGIYEDSEGMIYVASELGISMIRGEESSLLARNVEVIAFGQRGSQLFFACPDQLLVVDMKTREQKKVDLKVLGAGEATAMTMTGPDKDIYVGFRENGVAYVDPEDLSLSFRKTDMGRVRYLFPDPEGLLWVATERTGI